MAEAAGADAAGRPADAAGRPAPVVFLFLDGVGLGDDDPLTNPVAAADLPVLRAAAGGAVHRSTPPRAAPLRVFRHLDASLGYDGLPQSATGQTTLLTGRNAAAAMGRHYGPWPGPTLRPLLEHGTLFHDAQRSGGAALANVYPRRRAVDGEARRWRPNAPRVAAGAAGVPLRDLEAYRDGAAVPPDLSGALLTRFDAAVRPVDADGVAAVLAGMTRCYPFTFLDVWLTDAFGHAQDGAAAQALLERFDRVLGSVLAQAPDATVVVTSDHGNVEDVRTRQHTRNRVPLLAFGPGAAAFEEATSLLDVAPAIRRVWLSRRTG